MKLNFFKVLGGWKCFQQHFQHAGNGELAWHLVMSKYMLQNKCDMPACAQKKKIMIWFIGLILVPICLTYLKRHKLFY